MDTSEKNGGDQFPGGAGLREPEQGYMGSWLRGAGVCGLGVLIGFILGLAASPSSMSSASLLERVTPDWAASAPATMNDAILPDGLVARRQAFPDHFAVPSPSAAAADASTPGGTASGMDPLPSIGGMETCWSMPETVTC